MDDNFFSKNMKKLFGKDSNFVKDTFQSIFDDRGHANVLIAGSADVDTDGIIDSILQGDFATRGQGKMLTGYARELTREEFPLSVLVVRNSSVTDSLDEMKKVIAERNSKDEESRHIHIALMCFAEDSQENRAIDASIVEVISRLSIPVIGVVVKTRRSLAFKPKTGEFPPELGYVCGVRSSHEKNEEKQRYNRTDLEELARATAEQIPEGQRTAFIVTQKANCKLKHDRALQIVSENALISAGAGAVPIPVAGDVAILAMQARMLAKISSVYVVSFSSAFLSAMVTSVVGGAIAVLTGRLLISTVTKFIPGIGSIVGATTAAALTTGLGATYISILDALCKKNVGESPGEEEILGEIEKRFKKKKEDEQDQDESDEEENPDHRS